MRNWFQNISWECVTKINVVACEIGRAQHGISDSQSPKFKKLWEEKAETPMTFWAMLQLCKKMHDGAPFLNFNGNTFAALAAEASLQINYPNQFILEDSICNAIIGCLSDISEKNLRIISDTLEKKDSHAEVLQNQP